MSGVRLRRVYDGEEWESVVDRFPQATVFHRWSFLTEEARACGWQLLPFAAERGGRTIGVVPVVVDHGALRRTPTLSHPYTGPLVDPADLPDVLHALARARRARMIARVTVGFPPAAGGSAEAIVASRWALRSDSTYEVDLRSSVEEARDGAVLSCVRPKRRARIRHALQQGVEVHRVDHVDELLLRVSEQAYRAHGGTPVRGPGLLPWVDGLLAEGRALALEARLGPERLGVLVALRSGTEMFGWLGGVLAAARSSDAGSVLYHEMLRRAAAEGFERFDLVGHVDDGVAAFKRSLGAVAVPYWEATDAALPLRVVKAASGGLRPGARRAGTGGSSRAQVLTAPRSA